MRTLIGDARDLMGQAHFRPSNFQEVSDMLDTFEADIPGMVITNPHWDDVQKLLALRSEALALDA